MTGRILQLRRAGRPGCLLAAAIGTGVAGPALGQDDPQKVEVTAQPLTDTAQRRRDPVAKILYGRDELDKHGDVSLSDVLKRLPGIQMQGGASRLRGLGAGYTQLLVNGEPARPGFSLDNLSPSQVERVELTRGPTADTSARHQQDVTGDPQRLDVTGVDTFWGGGFNIGPRLTWTLSKTDTLTWQTFAYRARFNNQGGAVTEAIEGALPISVDDRFTSVGYWQMLRSGLTWTRKDNDGTRLELRSGLQASSRRSHHHTDNNDAAGLPTLVRDTHLHNDDRNLTSGGKYSRPLGEWHTLAMGWDGEPGSRALGHRTALTVAAGQPRSSPQRRPGTEWKGRGDELLHKLAADRAWLKRLRLRTSASVYRPAVDGIPGPDYRPAQQRPWSATGVFDQGLGAVGGVPPKTVGANLAWTPGYRSQQTAGQALTVDRIRTLEVYAMWAIAGVGTMRLAANNLLSDGTRNLTEVQTAAGAPQTTDNTRSASRSFNLGLTTQF